MPILVILLLPLVLFGMKFIAQAWYTAQSRVQQEQAEKMKPPEEQLSPDAYTGSKETITDKIKEGAGREAAADIAEKGVRFMQGPITGVIVAMIVFGLIAPVLWIVAIFLLLVKFSLHQEGINSK
jgi:hypothetical protein